MTKRIYLWAGPGAGKSTLAADIFQEGKRRGKSIELVREYAKELVWRGSPLDQLTLWAEQMKREEELVGKVDYLVTDSPWPLGFIYAQRYGAPYWLTDAIEHAALSARRDFSALFTDLIISATKPYVQAGRNETEHEARVLDASISSWVIDLTVHAKAMPAISVRSEFTGEQFWTAVDP